MATYISPEEIAEINARQNELEKTYREYGKTVNPSMVSLAKEAVSKLKPEGHVGKDRLGLAKKSETEPDSENKRNPWWDGPPASLAKSEGRLMSELDVRAKRNHGEEIQPSVAETRVRMGMAKERIQHSRKKPSDIWKDIRDMADAATKDVDIEPPKPSKGGLRYDARIGATVDMNTGKVVGKVTHKPKNQIIVGIDDGKIVSVDGIPEDLELLIVDTDTSVLDNKKTVRELVWNSNGHSHTNIVQDDIHPHNAVPRKRDQYEF